jgi:hypothetical protein
MMFPACYGIRNFVTLFTGVRNLTLSKPVESSSQHVTLWLIPCSQRPSSFPLLWMFYDHLLKSTFSLELHDMFIRIISSEKCTLWNSSLSVHQTLCSSLTQMRFSRLCSPPPKKHFWSSLRLNFVPHMQTLNAFVSYYPELTNNLELRIKYWFYFVFQVSYRLTEPRTFGKLLVKCTWVFENLVFNHNKIYCISKFYVIYVCCERNLLGTWHYRPS